MGLEVFGEELRRLRLRAGLSLRELAVRASCGKSHISDLEHGRRTPGPAVAAALDRALSAGGELASLAVSTPFADLAEAGDEGEVRRREFVGLTGAALFDAVVGPSNMAPHAGHPIEGLASVLVDPSPAADGPVDLQACATAVAAAKHDYQACRYSQVIAVLPALLRALRAASMTSEGDDRLRAHALSAEAYHVTASVLLKQEDKGLAWLAADRSVQAAHTGCDPLMIGSSARIITHALMDGGHHRTATDTARSAALRMDADLDTPSPDELSVYGSLLLRGAIAAARAGDRYTATELLDEAAEAGARLGHDGNHFWTAFGPGNVLCHRVNVALRLGDPGMAIEYARRVEIDSLAVNERKATLLLDASRAFLLLGRHGKALYVLRAAGEVAPEEISGRAAPRRLVRDILATAPPSVRREAREYAESSGVSA